MGSSVAILDGDDVVVDLAIIFAELSSAVVGDGVTGLSDGDSVGKGVG